MATYGAVELGGTKTLVATGREPSDLSGHVSIPTTTPEETLSSVIAHLQGSDLEAVGIASFGPVELRPEKPRFGHITSTPKPGWSGAQVASSFADALDRPVGFDTDVNGAALGEGEWGAATGLGSYAYITVGTGIGGGIVAAGRPLHGAPHPELGHVVVRRHPNDDHPGSCPFHGDCLEGMAAGPALSARFGKAAEELDGGDEKRALELETFYLAQGLRNLVYVAAPERIVVGGGVSKLPGLHDALLEALRSELADYPGEDLHASDDFVVPPGLGDLSGLAGALILAIRAAE